MRTLSKNKQKLKYALFNNVIEEYETDINDNIVYVEVDGEQIPVIKNKKIVYGEKTEEYREIKPYWASRLVNQKAESGEVLFDEFGGYFRVLGEPEYKPFTHVLFYAGYAKDRQVVEKKIESISIGKPQKGMCPEEWLNKDVFIIKFK